MQVWNVSEQDALAIGERLSIDVDTARVNSRSIRVKAYPRGNHFRRRSQFSRRRVNAICTHGFEALITALFEAGATRVKSTMGDWRSLDAFRASVPAIENTSIGNAAVGAGWAAGYSHPVPMRLVDACAHPEQAS